MNISPTRNTPAHDNPAVPMSGRERFLAACACLPLDRPPVWLMRQAGRSLPEYRALKEKHSFLEIVKTPELAAEATLQPIWRFGFDAAILFSDILVVPEALGQPYRFQEEGGIEMEFVVRTAKDIQRLDSEGVSERLRYIPEALALIKSALNGQTALLGFAGSPWTLANFMMGGGVDDNSTYAKALFHSNPALFGAFMEKITLAVVEVLQMQIDAGVDAIQIFDSAGGLLAPKDFEAASGQWIRQIIAAIKGNTPVILFSRGVNEWGTLVRTGANILSVDWTQSLAKVRAQLPENVGVQGNLDPALLETTPDLVAKEVTRILREMKGAMGHIFNLGHGVPPNARLECIQALVDTVRHTA